MKKYLFLFGVLIFGVFNSCDKTPASTDNCYCDDDPPSNIEKVAIYQGLWGNVWYWKGNFMPPGSGEVCQVRREVLIYELTTQDDVVQPGDAPFYSEIHTNRIGSVRSDKDGFFQIELPAGTYSIFVEENGMFYANSFSNTNIFPITVEQGEKTEIRFDITYNAYY